VLSAHASSKKTKTRLSEKSRFPRIRTSSNSRSNSRDDLAKRGGRSPSVPSRILIRMGSPFFRQHEVHREEETGRQKIRNTLRCRPGGTLRLPEFRRRAHPHSLRTERTHHRQRHPAIGQADFLQIQPQQCRGRAGGSARNPAPRGVALLHSGPFGIDGRAHRGEIPPAGATVETNLPRRRSPPSPSVSTEPACSSATTATAVLIEISEEWETGKAYLQTAETNPIR